MPTAYAASTAANSYQRTGGSASLVHRVAYSNSQDTAPLREHERFFEDALCPNEVEVERSRRRRFRPLCDRSAGPAGEWPVGGARPPGRRLRLSRRVATNR